VDNLNTLKTKKGLDVIIQFLSFTYNEQTGAGECFMEFGDQIMTDVIKAGLAELGAGSVIVLTFPRNDGDKTAAAALNRVHIQSKTDGFVEVVRGECNAKLMEKADELAEAEAAAAELDIEFSEKTAATLKHSLEDLSQTTTQIVSGMATKDSLSHLTDITVSQTHQLEDINDKIVSTAQYHEECRLAREKVQEAKLNAQTCMLNKLNQEINGLKDTQLNNYVETRVMLEQRDVIIRQKDFIIQRKDAQHHVIVRQKDEVIQQKDEVIQQKDAQHHATVQQHNVIVQQMGEDRKKLKQEQRALRSRFDAMHRFFQRKYPKHSEPEAD
jgi:hypothetical protein